MDGWILAVFLLSVLVGSYVQAVTGFAMGMIVIAVMVGPSGGRAPHRRRGKPPITQQCRYRVAWPVAPCTLAVIRWCLTLKYLSCRVREDQASLLAPRSGQRSILRRVLSRTIQILVLV